MKTSSSRKKVILMKEKEKQEMRSTNHNIRNMFLKQKIKRTEAVNPEGTTTTPGSDQTTTNVRTTAGVRTKVSVSNTISKGSMLRLWEDRCSLSTKQGEETRSNTLLPGRRVSVSVSGWEVWVMVCVTG